MNLIQLTEPLGRRVNNQLWGFFAEGSATFLNLFGRYLQCAAFILIKWKRANLTPAIDPKENWHAKHAMTTQPFSFELNLRSKDLRT